MANPTRRWDRVPVWGFYALGDDTPDSGKLELSVTQRVTRVDGRTIYAAGARFSVTIGDRDADPVTRSRVRTVWQAADLARAQADATAAGQTLDEVAWAAEWDAWWEAQQPKAVFASFPASDDPDIVQVGYQVQVVERLASGAGRTYLVTPLLTHLDATPPGINLGLVEVPPGSPTNPAPMYAKGVAGGVASLDETGKVPPGQLPPGLGGGTIDTTGLVTDDQLADALAALGPEDVGAQPAGAYATEQDIAAAIALDLADVIRQGDPRLSDARAPLAHAHPIGGVTGLQAVLDQKQTAAQVDARVQQVVGAAPAALDTLVEIAARIASGDDAVAALTGAVSGKVAQAAYDADKAALAVTLGQKQPVGDYATVLDLQTALALGFDIERAIERSAYTDDAQLQAAIEAEQTARGYALVVGPANP